MENTFKFEVTTVANVEIEINTNVLDKDFLDAFSEQIMTVKNYQELAEHIANMVADDQELRPFLEGIGQICTQGYDEKETDYPARFSVDLEEPEIELIK